MLNFLNTKFDTSLNADIFRAMSVAKTYKSDDELANLSKNVDAFVSAKKVSSGDTGEFSNMVYFQDAQSGEYVKLGLSDENLQAIRDKFDKSDFFTRDDGSIILNGGAGAYVAGWFGDIAYNREYLKADSDNDGFLDKAQMANTKSAFKENGIYEIKNGSISFVKTTDVISYQKAAGAGLSSTSHSIEAELNKTISKDKNLDAVISHNEALSQNERIEYMKKSVLKMQEPNPTQLINHSNSNNPLVAHAKQDINNIMGLQRQNSDQSKAMAASAKAQAMGQDALSPNERQVLQDSGLLKSSDEFLSDFSKKEPGARLDRVV